MREFKSIAAFLRFMETMPAKMLTAGNLGLADAARLIQETARAEMGHYQGPAGPFAAWPELAGSTQEEREKLGFTPNDPELRNGELCDAIEMAAGDGRAAVGVPNRMVGDGSRQNPIRDIGQVAIDQEFGTSRTEPRSFIGSAAFRKTHEAVDLVAGSVAATLAGLSPRRRTSSAEDLAADSVNDIPF